MHSVVWIIVRGDYLPSDDVIACQKVDVAVARLVCREGDPFKAVERSGEDHIPPVRFALIECAKLSDSDVIGHELSSLFFGIDLLVGETGKTVDGINHS